MHKTIRRGLKPMPRECARTMEMTSMIYNDVGIIWQFLSSFSEWFCRAPFRPMPRDVIGPHPTYGQRRNKSLQTENTHKGLQKQKQQLDVNASKNKPPSKYTWTQKTCRNLQKTPGNYTRMQKTHMEGKYPAITLVQQKQCVGYILVMFGYVLVTCWQCLSNILIRFWRC